MHVYVLSYAFLCVNHLGRLYCVGLIQHKKGELYDRPKKTRFEGFF